MTKEDENKDLPVMLVVKEHAFLEEIQVGFIFCFAGAVFFGAHMLARLFLLEGKLLKGHN